MVIRRQLTFVVVYLLAAIAAGTLGGRSYAQEWAEPHMWTELGFNQETRASGYQENRAWSASVWSSGEMPRMLKDDMALANALGQQFAVFARHGKYGDDAYDRSFADIPVPEGRRIVAASCNKFGNVPHFYAPVEKVARKNPGVGVFGINPKYDSELLIDRVGDGRVLLRVFETGTNNLVDSDDVFVYGKYCPKTDEFTHIPVAGSKGRQYLANKGIFVGSVPDSEVCSSSSASNSNRRGTVGNVSIRRPFIPSGASCYTLTAGRRAGVTAGTMLATMAVNSYLEHRAHNGDEAAASILEGQAYHARIVSNLERGLSADGQRLSWWEGWLNALGASQPP